MDLASVIGMLVCLGMVVFGIVTGDEGVKALWNFYDKPSILITFGGSIFAVMAQYSMTEFFSSFKAITVVFKKPKFDEAATIKSIIDLSNVARKEGLLALEEAANSLDDEFLKKGILLVVDGTDPEMVRSIMENDMICTEERHKNVIGFYDALGAMGPAWGMIGTLIGLINMLKNLSDINSVGPNMSVALVTTFYGSILANWLCAPVSGKMKGDNATEIMLKEVTIEGILSIQAGENPRVIEEKLKSFLSPEHRNLFSESEENGGGE